MKVERIEVQNFKALESMSADFNGCTAIITGANDKGKSTFLRGLFERLQGDKPTIPLKDGTKEGYSEVSLSDGSKLRWEFKEGNKEKLIYITSNGIKTPCTREICEKYYPTTFNVDTFLNDSPAKQRKQLQSIVGLDFSDIDARYKEAFDNRTFVNRKAGEEKIKFQALGVVAKVDVIDISILQKQRAEIHSGLATLYRNNQAHNKGLKDKWEQEKSTIDESIRKHNTAHFDNIRTKDEWVRLRAAITDICQKKDGLAELVDYSKLDLFISEFPVTTEKFATDLHPKEPVYIIEIPEQTSLVAKDLEITEAHENNRKADAYSNWVASKTIYENSQLDATEADKKVKDIEAERLALIKSANMPDGFTFDEDGILYKGLPFTRQQQSTSGIYIAALKLAEMTLGEIKTLHFDASFLDNNSLKTIQDWAKEKDLQLLIERPSLEGNEIEYQIIAA